MSPEIVTSPSVVSISSRTFGGVVTETSIRFEELAGFTSTRTADDEEITDNSLDDTPSGELAVMTTCPAAAEETVAVSASPGGEIAVIPTLPERLITSTFALASTRNDLWKSCPNAGPAAAR